jgi:hypothetical protein
MKASQKILPLVLLLYVVSFLFPAAVAYSRYGAKILDGAECAYISLSDPPERLNDLLHHRAQHPFFPDDALLLISGLINPVFLIFVITRAFNATGKAGRILRIVVLVMLPAPLYFFWWPGNNIYPKVGYFLWTGSMLLALFIDKLDGLLHGMKAKK